MAITITISGVDCTDFLRVGSVSIRDQLNGRNVCNFDLVEREGADAITTEESEFLQTEDGGFFLGVGIRPSIGQEVVIDQDGDTVFAGTIDEYEEEKFEGSVAVAFRVDCVDNNAIADRRHVALALDGELAGDIVRAILADVLAEEAVTAGTIQDGPIVMRAVFNYSTVADALNELADLAGFSWNIDHDRQLHFFARDANAAPWGITDSSNNFRKLKVKETREKYRNRQILRAGQGLTDPRTETRKGDGETRAWPTGFPIGEVPTSVSVNAVAKTIGIKGIDTGKDFYWNKGEALITQDDGATKLTASEVLSYTYRGLFPIWAQAQDDEAIADMKAREGGVGSGIIEAMESRPNLETEDAATDAAGALVRKYGRIPQIITFETDTPGLTAGQLLNAVISAHDLDADFLIESVTARDVNGDFLRYAVKALDGEALGGWQTFFRKMAVNGQQFAIRENEVVTLLRPLRDAATASDSVSVYTAAPETRADFATVDYSECA